MITVSKKIDDAIILLKKELFNKFGHDFEIVLFGSYARGDNEQDSDIDLLVLLPYDIDKDIRMQIFDIAYDIELEYDIVFNVVPYSRQIWNSKRVKEMPFYKNIEAEGKKI